MYKIKTLAILTLVSIIAILTGCTTKEDKASNTDTYYLLTRLGNDTLAVEKIVNSRDSILATVVLRSPKVRVSSYRFYPNMGDGIFFKGLIKDALSGETAYTQVATREGDSILVSINDGEREKIMAAGNDILPFIDMVHWPFDIILKRRYQLASDSAIAQNLWSGTRIFDFMVQKLRPDSMTLKHPSRGTMGVVVNDKGELVKLDASQTTRKLTVTRHDKLDFEAMKNRFIEVEKAGKGFGALSGRGNVDKTVAGVHYAIDFGTPSKRGRAIWGALVKYGERWRTGANRATHFSTDHNIMLGDLEVPPGEYTFFSIPEENTLTLIVNKQTGQNGRSYDEEQDLGRVELSARELDEVVEIFTIDVFESDGKVFLSLQWDKKAYEIEMVSK